jgi:SMODS-associated and fused to various effectors sensor domain
VSEALGKARPFGAPFFIRPTYDALPWTEAAHQQQSMVREIISKGRALVPRFSVFSIAPIRLIIHLGFLLSDRVEVHYFQFDRENVTWKWPVGKKAQGDMNIQVSGLPTQIVEEEVEVSVAVSLSAAITRSDVQKGAPASSIFIDLFVENPNVMWLKSPKQLKRLGAVFRDVLATIRSKVPECTKIHLFYAGPTGGGIVLGQQINPRMNPPVELYQHSEQTTPRYHHALSLTEDLS